MLFAIASLTFLAAVAPETSAEVAAEIPLQAKLSLASAVVKRQPQPLEGEANVGQPVYAFSQITGPGGGFVEHVWTRDGKEVARHYLPVGQNKHWRTWSRHTVAAGKYKVEVLGPDGKLLQETAFEVLGDCDD